MSIYNNSRRLRQRALDEVRRQTMMLVEGPVLAEGPTQPHADASTEHDPACQMTITGRLDPTCERCRAVLAIAGG